MRKSRSWDWVGNFLWATVGALVAYSFLVAPKLEFDYKVSLIGGLQILVTLLLAFYLQSYIALRNADFRIEKNLVQSKITECADFAKEARSVYHSAFSSPKSVDKLGYQKEIRGSLRNLANSLHLVEMMLAECRPNRKFEQFGVVKTGYFNYKKVLTGSSLPMTSGIYGMAEAEYRSFTREIFRLVMEVNRLR